MAGLCRCGPACAPPLQQPRLSQTRAWTVTTLLESVPVANSLYRGQEKHMLRELEVRIRNSELLGAREVEIAIWGAA